MTNSTENLTLIGVIIGVIMLAFYLMDKAGKAGDTNAPVAGGALPVFWWQRTAEPKSVPYDAFATSPARSTFAPGLVGDLQMWITSVATDTGLRW